MRGNRDRLQIIIENLDTLYTQKTTLLMPVKLPVNKIQKLQTEIAMLKKQRDAGITDEEKLSLYDDIFDFLGGIFGITADLVQFVTSIFPAILIDLLSPISSALFFYGVNLSGKSSGNPGGKRDNNSYKQGIRDAFKAVNTEIRRRLHDNI